ncbi:MAG: YdcF family protein [Bdellovibrionota bacterium]
MPIKKRLLHGLIVTALAALMFIGILAVATYFLAGEIYEYQDSVDGAWLPSVEAIVCLAGGRGRIAGAGDIWYRYWELGRMIEPGFSTDYNPVPIRPPMLFLSGMGQKANWSVFLKQLRKGVREVIKPQDVLIENASFNTEDNARWLLKYAEDHKWERILLVTSAYHMKRSRYILEQVFAKSGKEIKIETFSIYQEPFEPGEWVSSPHGIRVTLVEYLKWVYYKNFWKP